MKLKRDTKFGEESTRRFKIGIRSLIKIWPEHMKVSKIFLLLGSFWAKSIFFELKKYREIIFHENEEKYKIWREINLSFQNWHKEFNKIWPEHSKVAKIFTLLGSFWAKYVLFELKKYREVIFAKFEEKLTCCLENDTRSFANFHQSTQKCQHWNFD